MTANAKSPDSEPAAPTSFKLPSVRLADLKAQPSPKDWPHAPVHRLADNAVYFVTGATLHKKHLFDTPPKRDLLEQMLLTFTKRDGWQLEAWAVFANHYHVVARGQHDSRNLGEVLRDLHGVCPRTKQVGQRFGSRSLVQLLGHKAHYST
jgi:hypothetical protein